MTIEQIARRIAGEKNPAKMEKLIRAEANLIKELYPQLKVLSIDNLAHFRYEVHPEHSDLAAMEIVPIIFGIMANPSAYSQDIVTAARNYIKIAEENNIAPEFLGEEWRVWDDSEVEKFKAKGNADLIEKAMRRTVALRGRRQDVERKFEELLEQGFDEAANEEFSGYIRSIQDEVDNAYYDDWGRTDVRIFND